MSIRFVRVLPIMALCLAAGTCARVASAVADATGPSLTILAPADGATVSGSVTISAQATDPSGTAKVRFWADAAYLGYDMTAPYAKTWNTTSLLNGRYTLKVQAIDVLNNSTTKTVRVTVVNPDSARPSVAITAPPAGASVSGAITIAANASDAKGLQKVRFWAGALYLGYDSTAPYSIAWDTTAAANGAISIKTQAVDWANNTADATVAVTVANCTGGASCSSPTIGGCPVFPADNAWNADISRAPVHANSAAYIASIGGSGNGFLHADFGSNPAYGIPFIVVPETQPGVPVNFTEYGDESDPGPYPIPLNAPVESGSDAHTLALQQGTCKLYELYHAAPSISQWNAGSGAVWDLRSNALRPEGWTSADAAGLPILPGLARFDEVRSGAIRHALRVTVGQTQRGYIRPATHWASGSSDPNLPPMGLRLRLRADFDTTPYRGDARVILEALKTYGMIVADNGTSWFITGATDARWDDDDLNQLKTVPGSAFEAVDTGAIVRP